MVTKDDIMLCMTPYGITRSKTLIHMARRCCHRNTVFFCLLI